MKRVISVLMAIALILTMMPLTGTIKVSAASSGVQNKLDTLKAVYPGKYPCFTVSGYGCGSPHSTSNEKCSNCYLNNIPARNGLPAGSTVNWGSYSCLAFALYAFRYIYGYNPPDTTTWSKTDGFVRGDIICINNYHYGIYLGYDSSNSNYIIYDSNGYGRKSGNNYTFCKVTYNNYWPKSEVSSIRGYHATNYDAINGSSSGGSTTTTTYSYKSISSGIYSLKNKSNGYYMNLANAVDADKQNIHGYPTYYDSSCRYSISKGTYGYELKPTRSSTRLVNAWGSSPSSGSNVNIYPDQGNDKTQQWLFESVSGGYIIHLASNPNLVLTQTSGNSYNIEVSTRTGASNQIWVLESKNTYTIKFDANGGKGAPAAQTKTHGVNLTISSTKPTRSGYSFAGWSTTATNQTFCVGAGGTFYDNNNWTLYAMWTPCRLTINYNANGGIINGTSYQVNDDEILCRSDMSIVNHISESTVDSPISSNGLWNDSTFGLERDGYAFVGWSTDPNGESAKIFDQDDTTVRPLDIDSTIISGDRTVTVYAIWEDVGYLGTKINSSHFPDENFRNYLLNNIDIDSNGYLSNEEIMSTKTINVNNCSVESLKGIEYFTSLKYLYCYNNNLSSVDFSNNSALEILDCSNNNLSELDTSNNPLLKNLYCSNNNFTRLNVSYHYNLRTLIIENCTALTSLYCAGNELTTLDVSTCTALTDLDCYNSNLTTLDVSGCTALKELNCYENNLRTLDVSKNTALEYLNCNDNNLTELNVSGCTALTSLYCVFDELTTLDVSGCTALISLGCGRNELTTLDVSGCTALISLACGGNELSTLNVSKNTALISLDCPGNELTTLNVSKNTALASLYCNDNNLTELDVSKNTALTSLYCGFNNLTELDVSKNTALTSLYCVSNELTSLDISKNTALRVFYCECNNLTELDVSKNTALTSLYCECNNLTDLDVSKNTALQHLNCYDNNLTTLDVSKNTALIYLSCSVNNLTTLDVSKNTALVGLWCDHNYIISLDTSKNTALYSLVWQPQNIYTPSVKMTRVSGTTSSGTKYTGKPKLSWSAINGAVKYEVYRATSKDSEYSLLGTTTGTSYTNSGGVAGKTYYYKVKAIGGTGFASSDFSTPIAFTCTCATPSVTMSRVSGTTSGGTKYTGKPKLTWKAVTGASKYEVYRATSKTGTYTLLGTTTGTSYTNSGASAGKTYYYKVKAISKDSKYANSAYSSIKTFTCTCSTPSVSIALSSNKPKLTWKAITGASKYEVYRATSKSGSYSKIATTTSLSYRDSKASSGKTYYYKVKAISKDSTYANSAYSSIRSIKSK